ncbi:MAG: SpaA isopeptide-forming pilin-related protein, partial [Peptoniphilus sp.]
ATNKATIAGVEYDTKATAMAKVEELKAARDKAFTEAKLSYEWIDDKKQATKFTSNDQGQFEVRGIEYGDYRAVETKAPAGFALPTDGGNFTFKVDKGTYTGSGDIDYVAKSTNKDAMQIKNNDVTIPQTGGMGTVLFTVVGISLMAGAVIAMKRNREEA